jgi:hypothetical protein
MRIKATQKQELIRFRGTFSFVTKRIVLQHRQKNLGDKQK